MPFVVLTELELEIDHVRQWSEVDSDDLSSAERLLAEWTEQAWRRPVAAEERKPFLTLYQRLRDEGMGFDEALRAAFQSVLLSGPFRYLEPASESNYALASRLSFMLAGAPPDAELMELAKAGRLKDKEALRAQVDRLLNNKFIKPFIKQ